MSADQPAETEQVEPRSPQYFFYPQDTSGLDNYNNGISIAELFPFKTVACVTGKDRINISWTEQDMVDKIDFLVANDDVTIRTKYGLKQKDARDWTLPTAKADAAKNFTEDCIREFYYRPFDRRWTCYTGNSRGLYASPQKSVMQHLLGIDNVALVVNKQIRTKHAAHALVTNAITGYNILETANANPYIFPLLLSLEDGEQKSSAGKPYLVNVDEISATRIAEAVGIAYVHQPDQPLASGNGQVLHPIDIFDYCYAILHSNKYRTLYREFLNSDFPRIPIPSSKEEMTQVIRIGAALRELHLFRDTEDWELITAYPVAGSNRVVNKMTANSPGWKTSEESEGRVLINDAQYFEGVPQEVWEFYVGAYQPAQKWLKNRVGRVLDYEDIRHYQLIITCIDKTLKLMDQIDGIVII